ncbi:hypothetical protein Tsubulata_026820 [Turnera subulata]|uniref:Uncharacterized protein n=1 Tax=Turnera subulata TaxID=218843 RepID=A0A9Q0F3U1_9ROSI|nr:hypothetical protein Tsubulata_026820 [Turnera subulata]
MEAEPNHQPNNNKKKKTFFMVRFLNSPAAYVIVFLVAYTLGNLSASTPRGITTEPQVLLSPEPNGAVTKSATCIETQAQHFGVPTRCADPVPSRVVHKTILERIFNGTAPYHNFPPPHVGVLLGKEKLEVEGWGSYGAVFERLIRRVKPGGDHRGGDFLGRVCPPHGRAHSPTRDRLGDPLHRRFPGLARVPRAVPQLGRGKRRRSAAVSVHEQRHYPQCHRVGLALAVLGRVSFVETVRVGSVWGFDRDRCGP